MAAEAAPLPSLEAQHHEEYIDYSEDESTVPVVATRGSNHSSFSANAHFVTDVSENIETLPLDLDHQTADVQVDDVAVSMAVGALEGDDLENAATGDNENIDLVDESGKEAEDASFNENEISWEDGPGDERDADLGESHLNPGKEDWLLVDEDAHIVTDEQNPGDDMVEDEEAESHETNQAPNDSSIVFESIDTNPKEVGAAYVDSTSGEQQAIEVQASEADGDAHEIDYYGDGNASADALAEVDDTHPEHHNIDDENLGNAPIDQDVEDHAMGDNDEPQHQLETESNVAVTDGDGANVQELDGEAVDAPEYATTGDGDLSDHEQVEYDDEVLADVRSSISADTPSHGDMEIPVITVSYKGVDYPFFYGSPDSEGKECFFNDMTLLHCKMEGVLAGFRRELATELGPFDELVFQIDELGLEFAEVSLHPLDMKPLLTHSKSSQSEAFSDITLGQIISVFDSLVKNQDPDASKPLYAFLVTRPNCKKRWLSLVDDAYNGKGLDEICYYFKSQAPSEVPEIMDDEPGLIGEEDNDDAAAWPQSPGESDQGDQNDDQSQAENIDINEDDDVGDGITGEDDAQSQVAAGEDASQPRIDAVEELGIETTIDTEVSLMDESTAVADIDTVHSTDMAEMMVDQQPQQPEDKGNADCSLATPCFYPCFCICITCASVLAAYHMAEEDGPQYDTPVRRT